MAFDTLIFDAYGTLYDVQSVSAATEEAFPGHGGVITQVWRLKQLEYSWLRSMMNCHRDFWSVTEESLKFSLRSLGLEADPSVVERIMAKFLTLDLYPEAAEALRSLKSRKLAILSNGSQTMLDALVRNSGLGSVFDAVISVDAAGAFKPSPAAYRLVENVLGTPPERVLFVSSNAFDACGAKSFGFAVAWIQRIQETTLHQDVEAQREIGPETMFKILRMQMEELDLEPDYRVDSLNDLASIAG